MSEAIAVLGIKSNDVRKLIKLLNRYRHDTNRAIDALENKEENLPVEIKYKYLHELNDSLKLCNELLNNCYEYELNKIPTHAGSITNHIAYSCR